MKLSKTNLIILLLNIIILPLLGNKDLNSLLHLDMLANILNYLLPFLLVLSISINLYKNKYKIVLNINNILFILFMICLFISLIFGITIKGYTCTNLYKFSLYAYLLISLKEFDLDNKYIYYAIIYLTIFICLFGISQYLFNFQLSYNGVEKYIGSIGRIKSTFLIATIFDKYLSFIILYLIYLFFNNKANKFLLIITFILAIIALGLTYSRTGLLITILNVIVLFIYYIIKKNYFVLFILPLIFIILIFIPGEKYVIKSIISVANNKIQAILPQQDDIEATNMIYQDIQISSGNDYSVMSRDYYMLVAQKIIKNRPLYGIGIGNYTFIYENQNINNYLKNDFIDNHYLYPHNMYYQLGAEIGIIGMVSFMLLIIYNLLCKKNVYAILLLISILIANITESIFYIKDIAYITIILINLIPQHKKKMN